MKVAFARRSTLLVLLTAIFAVLMPGQIFSLDFGPDNVLADSGRGHSTDGEYEEQTVGDPHNIVQAVNQNPCGVKVAGRMQLNDIEAREIRPTNYALAYSEGNQCRTMALAFQLNYYNRDASTVAPENAGVSVNSSCTGCVTLANALQFSIPVDDPEAARAAIKSSVKQLQGDLKLLVQDLRTAAGQGASAAQLWARMSAFAERFRQLGCGEMVKYHAGSC